MIPTDVKLSDVLMVFIVVLVGVSVFLWVYTDIAETAEIDGSHYVITCAGETHKVIGGYKLHDRSGVVSFDTIDRKVVCMETAQIVRVK